LFWSRLPADDDGVTVENDEEGVATGTLTNDQNVGREVGEGGQLPEFPQVAIGKLGE